MVRQRYLYFELYDINDTAANLQTVWSVVHGPFFTASVNAYLKPAPHNVLGDQLYFTLLLYLPFWLAFPSPFTFVVVTIVAAGAAAVPLFYLARDRLGNPWLALLVAMSYLGHKMAYNTYFLFGFRPETLFMPFLFAGFLFLFRRQHLAALPFFLLTLLTKHDSILVLSTLGLYLTVFTPEHRRFGALLVLLALLYLFAVVIPLFAHFSYSDTAIMKKVAMFGPDPVAAVVNVALHPWLYFEEVSRDELEYLYSTLLPVGFLCLLSPYYYLAVPIILYNLLYSDYGSIHCGWHWALVVPFLYLGVVDALARVRGRMGDRPWRAVWVAAVALAIGLFGVEAFQLAVRVQKQRNFYYRAHPADTGKMIAAMAEIEPEASVSAMHRLLWFVAFRRDLFYNCHESYDPDYVVVITPFALGQNDMTDWCTIAAVEDPQSDFHRKYAPAVVEGELIIFKKREK